MSNNISFVGRVGSDATIRQAGQADVLNFRAASDVGYGERKTTNWFNIQVWGKRAQSLEQYIQKGKQLFISGELTSREYDKKDGGKGFSLDVNAQVVQFISDGQKSEEGSPSSPETDSDAPF